VFHDAYIGITTFFSRFWSLAQGAWGVRTLKLQVWRKLEITSSMFVEVISLSSLFFLFFSKHFYGFFFLDSFFWLFTFFSLLFFLVLILKTNLLFFWQGFLDKALEKKVFILLWVFFCHE
jgi:hypothetical protein